MTNAPAGSRHIKWYAPVELCERFKRACKDSGMKQTQVLQFFMRRFAEKMEAESHAEHCRLHAELYAELYADLER